MNNKTDYSDTFLGEELKKARKQKKLTLREVANSVGVSPSYIHRIENGSRRNFNYHILDQLKALYGIDYSSTTISNQESELLDVLRETNILLKQLLEELSMDGINNL